MNLVGKVKRLCLGAAAKASLNRAIQSAGFGREAC